MTNHQIHLGSGNNYSAERDINIFDKPLTRNMDLKEIIKRLYNLTSQDDTPIGNHSLYTIEHKILHNNLQKYVAIFDNAKTFEGRITKIYNTYNAEGSPVTERVLSYLNRKYLDGKFEFLNRNPGKEDIMVIRDNADDILDELHEFLKNEIIKCNDDTITVEAIVNGLDIIMCDAFIRCKILEEVK